MFGVLGVFRAELLRVCKHRGVQKVSRTLSACRLLVQPDAAVVVKQYVMGHLIGRILEMNWINAFHLMAVFVNGYRIQLVEMYLCALCVHSLAIH